MNTKIIVVSDNHMRTEGLKQILDFHANEVDYFMHCGDSNLEHDHEVMKSFITVKGNTDFMEEYQEQEVVRLASGEHVWIVHGHMHHVNHGLDDLLQATKNFQVKPSVILYGHTHRVDVQMIGGCLY